MPIVTPKLAALKMSPLPHQERVSDRLEDEHGLVAYHGTGTGKCHHPETWVMTAVGPRRLRELFEAGVPEEAQTLTRRVALATPDGYLSSVKLYRQPFSGTLMCIETKRGADVTCTPNHRMLVVSEGRAVWRAAAEIRPGDWLCAAGRLPLPTGGTLSADTAEFMAWLLAEGHERTTPRVAGTFCNADPAVVDRVAALAEALAPGVVSNRYERRGVQYLAFRAQALKAALAVFGYAWGNRAKHKVTPAAVFTAPAAAKRAYLRAFFDAEGSCDGRTGVELTTASVELAQQLQLLLLAFGIRAALHLKTATATNSATPVERVYARLHLTGVDLEQFARVIGFSCAYKQDAADRAAAKQRNPNMGVPVADILARCRSLGLGGAPAKLAGIRGSAVSASRASAERLANWLITMGTSDGRAAYRSRAPWAAGRAGQWAARTVAACEEHAVEVAAIGRGLQELLMTGWRFEPVTRCTQVASPGWVADIEIDTEDPCRRWYYCGPAGLISHNTMTAVNAAHDHDLPLLAVVPAALRNNMRKGIRDAGFKGKHEVVSYEEATKRMNDPAFREQASNSLVAFDEAARMGQSTSARSDLATGLPAKKKLFLTGTPIRNDPAEIAPLINGVAPGSLPHDPKDFKAKFIETREVPVGFVGRLMGVKPGKTYHPKNLHEFEKAVKGKVDFYQAVDRSKFPSYSESIIETPMSDKQHAAYNYVMGRYPAIAYKIRHGLPPSKSEEANFRAFFSGPRQVSNHPAPFHAKASDVDAAKIQRAADEIEKRHKTDPNFRGVAYSAFLDTGIAPLSRELHRRGIPHATFTGELDDAGRKATVEGYNTGKVPVMLISGAGAEGLDLKGTKLLQVMEPHWNEEQIHQVKARGIRYLSHAHLPEDERHVEIQRFHSVPQPSWLDRLMGRKRTGEKSVDEYLYERANEKKALNEPFLQILQGAPAKQANLLEENIHDEECLEINPTHERRPAILFDLDATLVHVSNWNDPMSQVVLPGRAAFLARLRDKGYALAAVTNRAVYDSTQSVEGVHAQCIRTDELLPGLLEDIYYIPDGPCPDHKPAPTLIALAMHRLGLDPECTIFVGDSPDDQGAAAAAGIPWYHPDQFFAAPAEEFPDMRSTPHDP